MSAVTQLLGPNGQPLNGKHRKPEDLKRTGFALAQVSTFSGIVAGISKAYRWAFDEALRNSPTNALAMRRDGTVMALLRERQMPSAQAKWHLEPEDQKDKTQKAITEQLTNMVNAIPRFNRLRLSLLEAIWFGRYGVQYAIGRRKVMGQTRYTVFNHLPVHGDKFVFRWDGTPGVLISQLYAKTYESGPSSLVGITDPYVQQLKEQGGVVLPTDRGLCLFLETPQWRERFAVHMHEQEDADFQEPELAGGIFGVGLRHRAYWLWWLRQETLAWMMDYLARVGAGGLTLIGYDESNPSGLERALEIGQQLENGNVICVPRPTGNDKPTSIVERIDPSQGGTQVLLTIVNDFFDAWMERLFVGQSMSGGADSESGLGGSGRAKFAQDTKHQLISMDCTALDECLTEQLIQPMKRWNFPGADFNVKFVTDLNDPDPKGVLDAVNIAVGMGVSFIEDEVRELTGLSAPGPDDKTIGGQQAMGGQPGASPQGDPQAQQMLSQAAESGALFDHDGLQEMASQLGQTGQPQFPPSPSRNSRQEALTGGKGDYRPDEDFDPDALAEGIRIEMEHTDDEELAKEIAKDHLTENADYYDLLEQYVEKKRYAKFVEEDHPRVGKGKSDGGRFTAKGDTGDSSESRNGSSHASGSGTQRDPFRCGSDIALAAKYLAQGHYVQLDQPDQLCTLIDKLHGLIGEARKSGQVIDLCKVTVPGTNLFCQHSKGIPRAQMPQMRGLPIIGSDAANKEIAKSGKVDVSEDFIDLLKSMGVEVKEKRIRASHLRASQNQIDGARVIDLIDEAQAGERDLRERPIFVTKDNYVLDGHHHWAALVGMGAIKDKDYKVPVHQIDMDIGTAIGLANDFAKEVGIAPKGVNGGTVPGTVPDMMKALLEKGGFTFDTVGRKNVEHGMIVSPYPDRSFAVEFKELKPKSFAKFVRKNKDLLSKPNHYLGGWHDTDSGKAVFDVVISTGSRDEAEKLSRKFDQKAYYDMDKKEVVMVNPDATSGGVL